MSELVNALMCYSGEMKDVTEPLFMTHERSRRIERLFRDGLNPREIAQRMNLKLEVVERVLAAVAKS